MLPRYYYDLTGDWTPLSAKTFVECNQLCLANQTCAYFIYFNKTQPTGTNDLGNRKPQATAQTCVLQSKLSIQKATLKDSNAANIYYITRKLNVYKYIKMN